jgi:uncharacterized protein (DUF1697 family)
MPTQPFIALLRGINVGGNNKIAMPELRALCEELGWSDVQSYIQSGNLVFAAAGSAAEHEAALEAAILRHFGLAIAVMVRAGADWPAYVRGNPFPAASEREPNLVMLALPKLPPRPETLLQLRERAKNGELIEQAGDALWFHYAEGVARSKLAPALIDRLVGSPVTARNWRTVLKLAEMMKDG